MPRYLEHLKDRYIQALLSGAVLLVFLLHASEVFRIGFVEQMENLAYDARLLATMPRTVDERIVIVDIDEKSITAEGRWPWNRQKMAQLLEQAVVKYRAGLVVFDIFFTEADSSSGLPVLEQLAAGSLGANAEFGRALEGLKPALDYDGQFTAALEQHPAVLGYYFNFDVGAGMQLAALPEPTFVRGFFKGQNIQFHKAGGYTGNLAPFQTATGSAGHLNPITDSDGVVRRVPMLIEYDGAYYASLSLEVLRRVLGVSEIVPRFEKAPFSMRSYSGLEWLQVGTRNIPVDRNVQTLVPYRGMARSFPYASATDVLHGTADDGLFEGKIVLVGTTSPGLQDLRATPVGEVYPGVEVHANLIAGMLDGAVKAAPEYIMGAEFLLLLLFGVAMIFASAALNPLGQTLLAAGLLVLYVAVNMLFWAATDTVFPLASGIMLLLLMFLLNMSYGYFVETRGKRQLTGLFGYYVPPELVEEMSRHPEHYSLAAESREMTVLFTDVRGFTTISEGLQPKELSELMNQFLTPMTRVIHEHRGTIDKYMGDAIMAFWGAPLDDRQHALHGVQAGLAMIARIKDLNKQFRSRGWPEIRIGVGVNTGMMSVGNMGSEFRVAYTVLGDAVNLGSRLEGLTKSYSVDMIVSETTADAVPEYAYRELDRVRVKGKDAPVAIFEPLGPSADLDLIWKDELKLYRQALKLYRNQEWDMAELQFLNLGKTSRSPALYHLYAERIAHFRKQPPPANWDGVFTYTTK